MKLYDAMTPNSLRVKVFLGEKGIDLPKQAVDVMGGGTRTPAFLSINSLGELPVLELDDGRILTESVAICRYFEALQPQPSLMGESPYDQALIEMWNRRMEIHIFGPIGAMARHSFAFFADKLEQLPEYAATQGRLFDKNLAWFDRELSDGRPFVTGARFTIADITGMAALMVCEIAGRPVPSDLKHTNRWVENMRTRPSFAAQMPEAA